jgi:hypothetical protein
VSCRLSFVLAVAAVLAPAGAGAFPTAAQGRGRPTMASLSVQVLPSEGGLVVTQAMSLSGAPGEVRYLMPLVLPETGPRPRLGGGGVRARGGEGTRVEVTPDGVLVIGTLGTGRQVIAEASYEVPVSTSRLVLSVTPDLPLAGVTVITRRDRDYGLHVRPLVPFAYREEAGEDGTWVFQTAGDEVPPGATLRIAVGHLPAAVGPYRAAALIIAALVLAGLGLSLLARRRA